MLSPVAKVGEEGPELLRNVMWAAAPLLRELSAGEQGELTEWARPRLHLFYVMVWGIWVKIQPHFVFGAIKCN